MKISHLFALLALIGDVGPLDVPLYPVHGRVYPSAVFAGEFQFFVEADVIFQSPVAVERLIAQSAFDLGLFAVALHVLPKVWKILAVFTTYLKKFERRFIGLTINCYNRKKY